MWIRTNKQQSAPPAPFWPDRKYSALNDSSPQHRSRYIQIIYHPHPSQKGQPEWALDSLSTSIKTSEQRIRRGWERMWLFERFGGWVGLSWLYSTQNSKPQPSGLPPRETYTHWRNTPRNCQQICTIYLSILGDSLYVAVCWLLHLSQPPPLII